MSYDHKNIDSKWQKSWEDGQAFVAEDFSEKPKFYALDMFPYPSGSGLHVGHMASYTPTDVVSRYKRQKGFNVLHPMGYDAFGLPAEQYAIQTGVHPAITTEKAIENFRRQLKSFGFSFDWTREIATCKPDFYKWTQFIFLELFRKGLAYQKEVPVNWCPALKTVLANEEVVDGKSERGGHPVIRKPMKQWMLKITDYADRLLEDLEKINWPDRTKEGQKNWIGRSVGAKVFFQVKDHDDSMEIFTTRPDTLFGATFMVLSPEHPLVAKITTDEQKSAIKDYVDQASRKSELDRKADTEKTGVFTGAFAINPLNNTEIPIWIADYVLMDYGTGAIMAVPGHDERDFEFATKFEIPILRVLESEEDLPFIGDGKLCNSEFLNGINKQEAIDKIVEHLEEKKIGEKTLQYKLRDWLFSRQRYWGEPFPILHKDGEALEIPLSELPVELPEVANYEPTEDGKPPLSQNADWVQHNGGERETDTMPGTAGSAWYCLRYTDPNNPDVLADMEKQKYWMPVDLYVGGPEHTVSHLLYSRFWQKVLFDAGLASTDEPFMKLAHQGMLLGTDGEKMSKSRGNVVNPDDVRDEYGADALRCFILFLGPMDRDKPWNPNGINGVKKFLDRVWRLCVDENSNYLGKDEKHSDNLEKLVHKTSHKVGTDIENLDFNTAISALMILVNEIYKEGTQSKELLEKLILLLAPFAPHMCEEVWSIMDKEGFVSLSP
ncbi:MAG: leucine--tRNA ligase, partial [Bdellovibrionales bacterium]|nr:leucine--tRNA ligase [Bdellovibrionales bacterium]NQZ18163.1 leucine--tRNA ligase [Bdellovibrionales bacterium]